MNHGLQIDEPALILADCANCSRTRDGYPHPGRSDHQLQQPLSSPAHRSSLVVPEATGERGELALELTQSTSAKWKNFAAVLSCATSADDMNDAHATIFGLVAAPEVVMVDTSDVVMVDSLSPGTHHCHWQWHSTSA